LGDRRSPRRDDHQEHRQGLLARFDAPSQALGFTMALRHALGDVGLRIRCGVHTGEVELGENGDITGTAVNRPARVEQVADQDTICVSSTVHDLHLGGNLHFTDLSTHALKGFERPWQLFALLT
jgi:class 3 adenylate cyclase